MTRPPPARRHLDPAGRWRLSPGLVGAGALIVALAGIGGLLHTWASGWDTARAAVPVPTVERSRFVAEEVPPLDVAVTSRSERSEVVATTTQMPIAPARTYAGAPEQSETQTWAPTLSSQSISETPPTTTSAPLTSTNAPTTTQQPSPTTASVTTAPTTSVPPTTSSPTQTTPTESEATVSLPDVTEVVESEATQP